MFEVKITIPGPWLIYKDLQVSLFQLRLNIWDSDCLSWIFLLRLFNCLVLEGEISWMRLLVPFLRLFLFCVRRQSPWLARLALPSFQSPRLSQQLLQMDWRTCGETWPGLFGSHGTESRPHTFPGNSSSFFFFFFQMRCPCFKFWLNLFSGFPPVSFFFFFFFFVSLIRLGSTALNAKGLWQLLKSFMFCSHWWGQAVIVELWLTYWLIDFCVFPLNLIFVHEPA